MEKSIKKKLGLIRRQIVASDKIITVITAAVELSVKKNNGKYVIVNDIKVTDMDVQ